MQYNLNAFAFNIRIFMEKLVFRHIIRLLTSVGNLANSIYLRIFRPSMNGGEISIDPTSRPIPPSDSWPNVIDGAVGDALPPTLNAIGGNTSDMSHPPLNVIDGSEGEVISASINIIDCIESEASPPLLNVIARGFLDNGRPDNLEAIAIPVEFLPIPQAKNGNVSGNAGGNGDAARNVTRNRTGTKSMVQLKASVLDELEHYLFYIKRMKKADPEAYGQYRRLGAFLCHPDMLLPTRELEPDFLRVRPESSCWIAELSQHQAD
jgi:hypothetical protein